MGPLWLAAARLNENLEHYSCPRCPRTKLLSKTRLGNGGPTALREISRYSTSSDGRCQATQAEKPGLMSCVHGESNGRRSRRGRPQPRRRLGSGSSSRMDLAGRTVPHIKLPNCAVLWRGRAVEKGGRLLCNPSPRISEPHLPSLLGSLPWGTWLLNGCVRPSLMLACRTEPPASPPNPHRPIPNLPWPGGPRQQESEQ